MNESRRHRLLMGLLLALAVVAGVALPQMIEWVDVQVPAKQSEAVRRNPLYAAGKIAEKLGASFVEVSSLDTLPPPDAVLLLRQSVSGVFADRYEALRGWVEQGGHLVLMARDLGPEHPAAAWLGIEAIDSDDDDDDRRRDAKRVADSNGCVQQREPPFSPGYFGAARSYRLCWAHAVKLRARQPVLWALEVEGERRWLRVRVGRGSVTVAGGAYPFDNHAVLQDDHALALTAAASLRPGRIVWLLTEETRTPLLQALWQSAAPAVLLAALAIALALWRAVPRFGPLMALPERGRRSLREQVAGTAHFLARHGPEALLAAQAGALNAAARKFLPGARPGSSPAAAERIAQHTGLDPAALHAALARAEASASPGAARPSTSPGELARQIALLETARRRLVARRHRSAPVA